MRGARTTVGRGRTSVGHSAAPRGGAQVRGSFKARPTATGIPTDDNRKTDLDEETNGTNTSGTGLAGFPRCSRLQEEVPWIATSTTLSGTEITPNTTTRERLKVSPAGVSAVSAEDSRRTVGAPTRWGLAGRPSGEATHSAQAPRWANLLVTPIKTSRESALR